MTDQSPIQEQSIQKKAHAAIPSVPAQAEEEQGVAYLDIKRNWLTCTHNMEGWLVDFNAFTAKVFFLKDGRIGMEQDGRVIVRRIEHWMSLGQEQS